MVKRTTINAWRYCLSAALCMLLYGYDASSFNAVQGYTEFADHFNHPGPNVIGAVTTASTVAAIVGGFFVSPPLSDTYGRKPAIFLGAVIVVAATLMQTFSPRTIAPYIVGRGLLGFAQGVALPAAATYLSEMAPTRIRGRALSFYQLFYSVGSFICFWAAYGTTKNAKLGNWRWQIPTLMQLICPALIIGFMLFSPESPRWLVSHGHIDRARKVLQDTRPAEDVEEELLSMQEAVAYEAQTMGGVSYKYFFTDPSTRWRFFLAVVINFGQQATGQGSLNNYSTIIYKKVFTSNSTVQLINALNATMGILFTLNASWAVERFGRKKVLICGAIGQAVCMFVVALVGSQTPTGANGEKSLGVGVGIVVLLFSFIFFYKPSWGATVWVFTSEIFSQQTRATGVGMASQVQNVANAILQQAFPEFLAKAGFYTFFFFCGINVLLALFCWFWVPETKGVPLEEIDTLFGGKDHRAEGQKIHEANEARADALLRDKKHGGMETPTSDAEKGSERRVEDVVEARREIV